MERIIVTSSSELPASWHVFLQHWLKVIYVERDFLFPWIFFALWVYFWSVLKFDLWNVLYKKRIIWLVCISKQSVDKKGSSRGGRMKRGGGGVSIMAADDVMNLKHIHLFCSQICFALSDPFIWLYSTVHKHIGETTVRWRQPCWKESAVLNVEVCFQLQMAATKV